MLLAERQKANSQKLCCPDCHCGRGPMYLPTNTQRRERVPTLNNTSHRGELVRGWSASGDLLASVVAGLLIGLGLDHVFNTQPVFVVLFVIIASVGGFYRLKGSSADVIDAQAREAIRIRDGL
jgi:F0F1-type ATP synthase assembly protein I